jgi:hypothetical protein
MMATAERRIPEGWHLKKEIQFGHIITTATVVAASFFYITKIEQRIALVEQQIIAQHERDDRQDRATAESLALIRQQLEKMDAKLDRALERR